MGWEGCVGHMVLARYRVQRSWRWESTGRSLDLSEGDLGRIFGVCLGIFGGLDFEFVVV